MMSGVEESDNMMFCASCGIAEVDEVKLKKCACNLVRYCGAKCQKEHRSQHKQACKKRATEFRDKLLFKQPESTFLGDCPICCLPLSVDDHNSTMMTCCSKTICDGCDYANDMRVWRESLKWTCPFCRHPASRSKDESNQNLMKRIEANDPVAMCEMGLGLHDVGDIDGAFEYLTKAAALGDVNAHFELSLLYHNGEIGQDEKKEVYHLEEAAIGGHTRARHNLGIIEERNGRHDRGMKHLIIAAKLGDSKSVAALKRGYRFGLVRKEDFASALRGHQAAVDETKSPQRDEALAAQKD